MTESLQTIQSQSMHRLVAMVNKIVPLSVPAFVSVLSRNFPHRRADAEVQLNYFLHVLQFLKEIPDILGTVFPVVIDKLQSIDLAVKSVELEHEPEPAAETVGIFMLDEEEAQSGAAKLKDAMARKIDLLMHAVLSFVIEGMQSAEKGERSPFFKVLLRTFQESILTTQGTQFVQFIVLVASSVHKTSAKQMLDLLLEASLCDPGTSIGVGTGLFVERSAALSYLGSFVSRGTFFEPDDVAATASHIVRWLESRVASKNPMNQVSFDDYFAAITCLLHILSRRANHLRKVGSSNKILASVNNLLLSGYSNMAAFDKCNVSVLLEFGEVYRNELSEATMRALDVAVSSRMRQQQQHEEGSRSVAFPSPPSAGAPQQNAAGSLRHP